MVGRTISHYRILEKIGQGGMGVVYKAEDTRLQRVVALKFLPPEMVQDRDRRRRFLHEARSAAALTHPHICTIHQIDEVEDQTFIVMEYVEGATLKERLGSGPLPLDEVLDLAGQVAEGLAEAHEKGIVHRDIKPANIMITPKGQAKIMDFGLAKSPRLSSVAGGAARGTLGYMSPEQTRGDAVDHRTDIWSFGVVLYEMLTGVSPFKGDYEQAVVYSILNEHPDPPSRHRQGLPADIDRALGRALSKDPDQRYSRVQDLASDLGGLREATRERGSGGAAGGRLRAKLWVAAGVVVALAVLALLGVKVRIGQQPAAVAEANSLAVMYFDNLTDPGDPERLGEIITNLLITDLSESEYVKVLSSQRLYDILNLLGQRDRKRIDRTVASQVAGKAQAKWMLLGSVLQVEPRPVITSQLVDVESGNVEASQRIEGRPGEDLFALVDRLTVEVKRDLSLPQAALAELDPAVAGITTHSAEAYRHYLEGVELQNRLYYQEAEEAYRRAVRADTAFAMAYLGLSMMGPRSEREQMLGRAAKHADRVSRREREYIEALAAVATGDRVEGIRRLEAYAERYPDDKESVYRLGLIHYSGTGDCAAAVEALTRAIEIDPLYPPPYNVLAYAYELLGDHDRSLWAVNRYMALAPQAANPYDSRGDLHGYQGRIDEAIACFQKALEIKPDFAMTLWNLGYMYTVTGQYARAESCYHQLAMSRHGDTRSYARYRLALIPLHQGRLQETLRILDDAMAADRLEEGAAGLRVALKHVAKGQVLSQFGLFDRALEEAGRFLDIMSRLPPGSPYQLQTSYSSVLGVAQATLEFQAWYAYVLAGAGDAGGAEEILEQMRERVESGMPHDVRWYWKARGSVDLALGRPDRAIDYLLKAAELCYQPRIDVRYPLGEAYLQTGQMDRSVDVLERALTRYDCRQEGYHAWFVKAHYLLGLAYERSGWTRKAVEEYETFLRIWKDADSGIPEIEDARARLEKLTQES